MPSVGNWMHASMTSSIHGVVIHSLPARVREFMAFPNEAEDLHFGGVRAVGNTRYQSSRSISLFFVFAGEVGCSLPTLASGGL
jgi:hypothetical protein